MYIGPTLRDLEPHLISESQGHDRNDVRSSRPLSRRTRAWASGTATVKSGFTEN